LRARVASIGHRHETFALDQSPDLDELVSMLTLCKCDRENLDACDAAFAEIAQHIVGDFGGRALDHDSTLKYHLAKLPAQFVLILPAGSIVKLKDFIGAPP
jgi:hypothetical protein